MCVHVLQHVPFEGLGSIDPWLKNNNATLTVTRLFESSTLPKDSEVDMIIALGGPMSVNDEAMYPWLTHEKRFLARAIQAGKAVLGICLGAQLIASALGARVYANQEKEIGWFPIISSGYTGSAFQFPQSTDVFHWHGETFDLPTGAVHLARSEACAHQAFQIGERVIGLQFHLETTPQSLRAIVDNCRNELTAGRFVQNEPTLRAISDEKFIKINTLMDELLEYLTR